MLLLVTTIIIKMEPIIEICDQLGMRPSGMHQGNDGGMSAKSRFSEWMLLYLEIMVRAGSG